MSDRELPFEDGAACGEPPDARDSEGRCGLHGVFKKTPQECLTWLLERIEACPGDASQVDFTRCVFPSGFALPDEFEFVKPPNFRKSAFGDGARFWGATFGDRVGFWGATFGDGVLFEGATFGDDAGFKGTIFGDGPWFGGATFGDRAGFKDATFGGGAGFKGAAFGDGARFEGATFGDRVGFGGATFGDGVLFEGATFGDRVGFGGATFGDGAGFWRAAFGDRAGFQGATFGGGAEFEDATFGDRAGFQGATFGGGAGFDYATFGGHARFQGATFGDRVGFGGATFGDGAGFGGAAFGDGAVFRGATFGDGAVFGGATFGDGAGFEDATFGDGTWFTGTTFHGATNLSGMHINGSFRLSNATFQGISDWNKVCLAPAARITWKDVEVASDLRLDNLRFPMPEQALAEDLGRWENAKNEVEKVGKEPPPRPEPTDLCYQLQSPDIRIDFRNVPIRATTNIRFQGSDTDDPQHRLDCSKILFTHTDVSRIRFRNCKWDNEPAWRSKLGRFLHPNRTLARVADEDYLSHMPRKHESKVPEEERIAPSLVADVYKGLRVSYEDNLRQADAGRFHIREMEMRRLALGSPPKNATKTSARTRWGWGRDQFWSSMDWTRRRGEWLGLTWYRWTSRYGESFVLPAALLFGWVFLFGWLLTTDLPDLPWPLAAWYADFSDGLVIAPKSVAGRSGLEFLGRLGGAYFVAVAVVALRRHFRRHRGGI